MTGHGRPILAAAQAVVDPVIAAVHAVVNVCFPNHNTNLMRAIDDHLDNLYKESQKIRMVSKIETMGKRRKQKFVQILKEKSPKA